MLIAREILNWETDSKRTRKMFESSHFLQKTHRRIRKKEYCKCINLKKTVANGEPGKQINKQKIVVQRNPEKYWNLENCSLYQWKPREVETRKTIETRNNRGSSILFRSCSEKCLYFRFNILYNQISASCFIFYS